MSKKTVVAVAEYLRQQTGDPNLAPRPVLRSLVESGRIGAVSGKGWYEFNGDYASIVGTETNSSRSSYLGCSGKIRFRKSG